MDANGREFSTSCSGQAAARRVKVVPESKLMSLNPQSPNFKSPISFSGPNARKSKPVTRHSILATSGIILLPKDE
jgi:hypothetical protein